MAASRSYVDDIGTNVRVDTGIPLTGATTLLIKVKKPSGATEDWEADQDGTTTRIIHVTEAGDLDEIGSYLLQAYVVNAVGSWRGDVVVYEILDEFT